MSGKKVGRDVATLLSGAVVAQVIPALAIPVYARLFDPAQVAVWVSFTAFAGVASAVLSGRLDLAMVLPSRDKWSVDLYYVILALGGGIAVFLSVASWFVLKSAAAGLSAPEWLPLLPLVGYAISVNQAAIAWQNRRGNFRVIAVHSICQQLLVASAVLALAAFGYLRSGLILGSTLGHSIAAAVSLRLAPSWNGPPSWRRSLALLRRYAAFLKYNVPYSVLTNLSVRLPVLVLLSQGAAAEAGYAGVSRSLVFLPVSLLTASLGRVFFRSAAQASAQDTAGLVAYLLPLLLKAGVVAFAVGIVLSGHLVPILLGEDWIAASQFVIAVAPAAFLYLFTGWSSRIYEVAGAQHRVLGLQVIGDASAICAGVLAMKCGASALAAMWLMSAVSVLQSSLLLEGALNLVGLRRFARYRFVMTSLLALATAVLVLMGAAALGGMPLVLTLALVLGMLAVVWAARSPDPDSNDNS